MSTNAPKRNLGTPIETKGLTAGAQKVSARPAPPPPPPPPPKKN